MDTVTELLIQEPTIENASSWQKFLARMGMNVFLGYGRRKDWKGRLPFYLFLCPRCKNFGVDYLHGFPGEQYLSCHKCHRDELISD